MHSLVKLRRAGVTTESLSRLYISTIRPIMTYCAPAWYPYTSQADREKLYRTERLALRIITPHVEPHSTRVAKAKMPELSDFLHGLCDEYVSKVAMHEDHPCNGFIPPRQSSIHRHSTRLPDSYICKAKSNLRSSNLFYHSLK